MTYDIDLRTSSLELVAPEQRGHSSVENRVLHHKNITYKLRLNNYALHFVQRHLCLLKTEPYMEEQGVEPDWELHPPTPVTCTHWTLPAVTHMVSVPQMHSVIYCLNHEYDFKL